MAHLDPHLDFVVQPPSEIRPNDTLYPPPVVKISITLEGLWAYATLLNHNGQIVEDLLSGTLVSSAQSLPKVDISNYPTPGLEDSYVVFPDLKIKSEKGEFKIRITLMQNSFTGTASCEEIESGTITVHDGASSKGEDDEKEKAYLEALRADGRDI